MNREEKIKKLLGAEHYSVDDLCLIMEVLRGEGGCPWDREQTHKSIRRSFIEETYEAVEAIDNEDTELLREELGDVLLQVVFHSQIEAEAGSFAFGDVADDICRKLIHRHPHVFGDISLNTPDEVLVKWDAIKNEEKQRQTITERLRAVPRVFPALMRAEKVGKRACCFDFPDASSVMDKVYEEADEVREAMSAGDAGKIDEEIGDLLLTVTSLARKAGVDPEASLMRATDKFISRFEKIENKAIEQGYNINAMTMDELDKMWDKIK